MNARELVTLLLEYDPNAEVMVTVPLECCREPAAAIVRGEGGQVSLKGSLSLPTRGLETGMFPDMTVNGAHAGKPWVMIQGTDVWGMSPPAMLPKEPPVAVGDVLRIGVDGEGLTRIIRFHYQQGRHDLALQLLSTCPGLTVADAFEVLHGRKKFMGVVRGNPGEGFELWGDSADDGVGR